MTIYEIAKLATLWKLKEWKFCLRKLAPNLNTS